MALKGPPYHLYEIIEICLNFDNFYMKMYDFWAEKSKTDNIFRIKVALRGLGPLLRPQIADLNRKNSNYLK